MLSYSLTIPKNGTIVIPKEIRDMILTNNIILRVDDNKNISILPVKDLRGCLSAYKNNNINKLDQEKDESDIAWEMHINEKFSKIND